MGNKYRNYFKALSYVNNLELKNEAQWKAFAKSKFLPNDIPQNPKIYPEWKSYENWLGLEKKGITEIKEAQELGRLSRSRPGLGAIGPDGSLFDKDGNLIGKYGIEKLDSKGVIFSADLKLIGLSQRKNFFKQLRSYARKLNLKNRREWRVHYSKNINRVGLGLVNPDVSFKNDGWISWGDFLGNYNVDKKNRSPSNYLTYEESSELINKINEEYNQKLKTLNKVLNQELKKADEKKLAEEREMSRLREKISKMNEEMAIALDSQLEKRKKQIEKLKKPIEIKNAIDWRKFYLENKDKMNLKRSRGGIAVVPFRPEKLYKDKWQGFTNWSGYNLHNLNNKILDEWNWEKNRKDNLHPENLSPYSQKKVWWNCPKGHAWKSSVKQRINLNKACPECVHLKKIKEIKE